MLESMGGVLRTKGQFVQKCTQHFKSYVICVNVQKQLRDNSIVY